MKITRRINKLIKALNKGIYEKEEIVAISLLGALAGLNIFLLGPPGTAKSLVSRRLSSVFDTNEYFEYLMNKFSTPEEVFGPISITEMKKDNYVRKIEGYLPTAEVVFLDEIWKANSAILNSLLTIINEKKFRNGSGKDGIKDVNLKVLISASNETPPPGQGLEAIYDRFVIRLNVFPTEKEENFFKIIEKSNVTDFIEISGDLKISVEELKEWEKQIELVKLTKDTFKIIKIIRLEIENHNENIEDVTNHIVVSDRRWQKAVFLLKAGAYFSGRSYTNRFDTQLLRYCLWSTRDDHKTIVEIVDNTLKNHGFYLTNGLDYITQNIEVLETNIKGYTYQADVYKNSRTIIGKEFIMHSHENQYHGDEEVYIPLDDLYSEERKRPVDENGDEVDHFTYYYDKRKRKVMVSERNSYEQELIVQKLHIKGTTKENIDIEKVNEDNDTLEMLQSIIEENEKTIINKRSCMEKEKNTIFISEILTSSVFEGVKEQLKSTYYFRNEVERLMDEIKNIKK